MTNTQFWNSITMDAQEFKDKYFDDVEFWNKYGQFVYKRLNSNLVKDKTELSEREKQLLKFKT